MQHGVLFEPLTPIEGVSVIGACVSLHLDMPLDLGHTVRSQASPLRGAKHFLVLSPMPVFFGSPLATRVGVSSPGPTRELMPEDGVTSCKDSGRDHCFVVGGPSPDNRIQFLDEAPLRC